MGVAVEVSLEQGDVDPLPPRGCRVQTTLAATAGAEWLPVRLRRHVVGLQRCGPPCGRVCSTLRLDWVQAIAAPVPVLTTVSIAIPRAEEQRCGRWGVRTVDPSGGRALSVAGLQGHARPPPVPHVFGCHSRGRWQRCSGCSGALVMVVVGGVASSAASCCPHCAR